MCLLSGHPENRTISNIYNVFAISTALNPFKIEYCLRCKSVVFTQQSIQDIWLGPGVWEVNIPAPPITQKERCKIYSEEEGKYIAEKIGKDLDAKKKLLGTLLKKKKKNQEIEKKVQFALKKKRRIYHEGQVDSSYW